MPLLAIDTASPFLTVSITDIDGHIASARNSLSVYPRSHFAHITGVYALSMARFERYMRSQQKEDLDKCIVHCTDAIFLPTVCQAGLSLNNIVQLLFHLAFVLLHRSEKFKQPHDIKYSIEYLRYLQGLPLDSFDVPRNIVTTSLIRALAIQVESEAGGGHGISRRW